MPISATILVPLSPFLNVSTDRKRTQIQTLRHCVETNLLSSLTAFRTKTDLLAGSFFLPMTFCYAQFVYSSSFSLPASISRTDFPPLSPSASRLSCSPPPNTTSVPFLHVAFTARFSQKETHSAILMALSESKNERDTAKTRTTSTRGVAPILSTRGHQVQQEVSLTLSVVAVSTFLSLLRYYQFRIKTKTRKALAPKPSSARRENVGATRRAKV